MAKHLTIIDFSSLLYSVSNNCNKDIRKDDFSYYRETLDSYVLSILQEANADYYLAFGDSITSFRNIPLSLIPGTGTLVDPLTVTVNLDEEPLP